MTSNVIVTKESPSLISRSVLVVCCLAAGFAYRASVSLIPTGVFEDSFLLGLAALLLTVAVLTRKSQNLRSYWELPFAFFVFIVAGLRGMFRLVRFNSGSFMTFCTRLRALTIRSPPQFWGPFWFSCSAH